jgi:predicted transcriptional regulator
MTTMGKTGREEVEDAVIQAIGHRERRNILKIINASPNGSTYSEILGETELNTGHLNYHLRGLEGLIERSESRQYRLTPLGYKALHILSVIGEQIETEDMPYINTAVASQTSLLHPMLIGFINVVSVIALFGLIAGLWLVGVNMYSGDLVRVLPGFVIALICGVEIIVLFRARKSAPEYLRRLERRYLK